MRKLLILCILAATAGQLKAQQLVQPKPGDGPAGRLLETLKAKPGQQLGELLPGTNQLYSNNLLVQNITVSKVDRMPVLALSGSSKMPVAKLGGYDKMPVAKPGAEGLLVLPKIQPGVLPGLKTP